MQWPGFCSSSFRAQSSIADQEDVTNLYHERAESQFAPAKDALYPTPGVEQISFTVGGVAYSPAGGGRCNFLEPNSRRWFAVIGTSFIELTTAGIATVQGTVADDGLPATIISNGDVGQMVIASGGNGYLFLLATDTFSAIGALAGIASKAAYSDGFGLILDVNTSTIYQSDLLDLATWDPTNFIQRNDQTDPWIDMQGVTPYVWALGTQTGLAYYDAGSSPIAFAPHPSGKINFGSGAQSGAAVVDGSLAWLSATKNGQGQVIRLAGFTPEVISTFSMELAIAGYTTLADVLADSYDERGHTFFLLAFPSGGIAWCWDSQAQEWHKRGKWNSTSLEWEAPRPFFHALVEGRHMMLDRTNGNVYEQSVEFAADVDGDPIVRERIPPALAKENQRLYVSRFELWLEAGLGLTSGQGSNPRVTLEWSKDGGKTWGTVLTCSAGAQGEYGTRVFWSRLPMGRMVVPRLRVSDPIPWRLLGAFVDVEAETA